MVREQLADTRSSITHSHTRGISCAFNRHGCTVATRVATATPGRVQTHAGKLTRRDGLQLRHRPTRNEEVEMREQPSIHKANG